ncbi:MAG: hypothetical protein JWQ72_911 [Polaromonas sp.]|nr:hypothetical protein [Polaromonas sp.]
MKIFRSPASTKYLPLALGLAATVLLGACAGGMGNNMSFFVTSTNPGKGGDLGGLAGADAYCQQLAATAGAGGRTWRAYLSSAALGGATPVNARDRIGAGPWRNAKGEVVAMGVDDLHSGNNNLSKQTNLSEKGEVISGRGDAVNMHDILTGSTPDGRAYAPDKDTTCGNWSFSTGGSAMLGHHDRIGLTDTTEAKSWNSSHPSRACDMASLKATGGAGLMYCFATN